MSKRIHRFMPLCLILALLTLLLTACPAAPPPTPALPPVSEDRLPILTEAEATTATVYYATLDKNYLLPLNININATKEVARVAMEKLLAGPPAAGVAPVLPQDTKLLDLYSSKSTVYVNVTRDIFEVEWQQSRLAMDAILNTILPLAEGYTLQLLIEGQVRERLGSVDISRPLALAYVNPDAASRDLLQSLSEEKRPGTYEALTYYLADAQAMFLVPQTLLYLPPQPDAEDQPERVEQEIHDEREELPAAYARAVLAAMLAPAEEESVLSRPFWPGTELLDLWVEDNIVYVDFSAQLTGYGGGTATESMMLTCLTQTLTALPGISAVQVLIEGRPGSLPEGFDISRPLTPSAPVNAI